MFPALLKGLTLGLLLSISVGPVIFSILKQSINNGHKGGFAFIAGVSASDITLVFLCNFFTQFFNSALTHEAVFGTIGSIFLMLMGVYNIFFKKTVKIDNEKLSEQKFHFHQKVAIFLSGYFMNLLNPGVFLFWFAASATILDDSLTTPHPLDYRIIVFATCLLFVLSADVAKVLLANNIRTKLTPHNIHIIDRISGLILIGFGIVLLYGILTGKVISHK
ncbi:MAG: LysE family translocator [Chitinophagaceae bacterium]